MSMIRKLPKYFLKLYQPNRILRGNLEDFKLLLNPVAVPRSGRFGFAAYSPKCDLHSEPNRILKKDEKLYNFLKLNDPARFVTNR
ncbi:hypothetical protein C6499_12305 [Candidatus Poribacteria bacterium]|nr:MAG: hypothetical protein C6499_12305 [Candidatus Poribacteria bacterium]